ncbi:cytochrome c oxidase assembly protein [Actinoplanes sp. NPDC051411]|uniref:cytochrome c oxidase assembly protein n=1 Tax=Actinoplanes sp. NPDC051411 TaxID=3155522 RepID=UPI0034233174
MQSSKSWLTTAALTAVLAVGCHRTLQWRTTPLLAGLAVFATLPIITAGQSSSDNNHDLATAAIGLHIPAAVIWLGTLVALLRSRGLGADRDFALRRYRRLSIGCWWVVAYSGLIDGALLAPGSSIFTTWYGVVLLVKIVLLAGLGRLSQRLRRRMLHDEAPPRRLLTAELGALIAAFGFSAALTDLPAPKFLLDVVSADETIIGYNLGAPPTALRLLFDWRLDLLFAPLCVVLGGAYLASVRRLGERWPWHRTAVWLAGCAVLLFATSSGLGRYGAAMFSVEAVDHVLVGMLVPLLLTLGAPL